MTRFRLMQLIRTFIAVLPACIFILSLANVPFVVAETQNVLLGGGKELVGTSQETWKIDAAKLQFDQNNDTYLAEGDVLITSGNRSIQADWASLNSKSREAELRGHVRVRYAGNWVEGEHVVWNLDKETGVIDNGLVFFAQNHFYVQGKNINKTGPLEYELKDGYVTSCDPTNPDWKVKYQEMSMNLDGVSWLKKGSFWVKDVPLIYAPVLAMPVELERQSGFLMPWAGSSTLDGLEFEIPYYWAMRKDMDATFYGRYMENRGFMSGVEYRVNNRTFGEGIWLFNYLKDDASKAFLAEHGFPFETSDRYWLRGRHSLDLPNEIEVRLDVDFASDRNYLQEFGRGSTSYDYSNKLFRDLMGRGILNDKTILARESALYVDKRFEDSLLSFDARYWDQLDNRTTLSGAPVKDLTLERLPALSYSIIPTTIKDLPLYYTWDSSFVNYWRRVGDQGQRLDLSPRLYSPLKWGDYLNVETSAGLRSTSYMVDWDKSDFNTFQDRFLSDVRVEMSSRVNRVYPFSLGSIVAFQHAIRPTLTYEYVPDPMQGDLPQFDRLDENPARHDIRFGVSNIFTTKEVRTDEGGNPVSSYREVAKIDLFQTYNIEKMPLSDDIQADTRRDEGLSAVGVRVDLMPQRYVTVSYDGDLYNTGSNAAHHDLFLKLDSGMGHMFRFDYAYQKDLGVNELIAQLMIKTLPNLYLDTYHDYSMQQDEIFKQGYGFKYVAGCWSFGLGYERELGDDRVIVSVNLLGIGGYGKSTTLGTGTISKDMPFEDAGMIAPLGQ